MRSSRAFPGRCDKVQSSTTADTFNVYIAHDSLVRIHCSVDISWSYLPKYSQDTSHNSPVGSGGEIWAIFVSQHSDVNSTFFVVALHSISCYTEPLYIESQLYCSNSTILTLWLSRAYSSPLQGSSSFAAIQREFHTSANDV